MKCPVCAEEGKTSMVYCSPAIGCCPVGSIEYWDDDGNLHVHDSTCRLRGYHCTNGHHMTMAQYDSCPSCSFNEGKTELWLNSLNKVIYRFTKTKEWKKVVLFGDR